MKRILFCMLLCSCATSPDDDAATSGGGGGGKADGDGCTYSGLVQVARDALAQQDPFFQDVEWNAETGARPIADLNGDAREDVIVQPGYAYAGSSVELAIFVSNGDACAMRLAGNVSAAGVTPSSSGRTNGLRDLDVSSTVACTSEVRRYKYDGTSYKPSDDVRMQDVCRPVPPPPPMTQDDVTVSVVKNLSR